MSPATGKVIAFVLWSLLCVLIGVRIGSDHQKGKENDRLKEEQAQVEKNDQSSSDARVESSAEGNRAAIINEGETHASQERIRVVYRTVRVAADCRPPDGVVFETRAAIERANSAVRAAGGAPDPAVSGREELPRERR